MNIAFVTGEWLLVLAFVLFVLVLVWFGVTVVNLKNSAMRSYHRLADGPVRSTKNLIVAGKGVVQQETVRVKHIGAIVKDTAATVKETATEVKEAVQSIPVDEIRAMADDAQEHLRFVRNLTGLLRSVPARARQSGA